MFYDRFLSLCEEKGVKPTNACIEAGLSRGLAAKWKSTGTEKPSADALEKLSAYFDKSIDEILGNESAPTQQGERKITEADLKAAFFEGAEDLTQQELDEMWADAMDYVQYKIDQKRRKKND